MPRAAVNGIEIAYETFGPDDGEPLLLIMGLGAQMIMWDEELCERFVGEGFRVIRFDNRDVGKSSWLHDLAVPDVRRMMLKSMLGLSVSSPYTLSDMAADAAGLLDHLGLASAHVAGASMGGMITQTLALEHPHRVRTLTSIMSHTGDCRLLISKPSAMRALLGPAPRSRDEAIQRNLETFRVIGSPGFPFDHERIARRAGRAYDRGHYPRGFLRQLGAILASGGRAEALRRVRTPALVIHGSHDPLIRPIGGYATARAIPGARLRILDGMGHDLPVPLWPEIVTLISRHARGALPEEQHTPWTELVHRAQAALAQLRPAG